MDQFKYIYQGSEERSFQVLECKAIALKSKLRVEYQLESNIDGGICWGYTLRLVIVTARQPIYIVKIQKRLTLYETKLVVQKNTL